MEEWYWEITLWDSVNFALGIAHEQNFRHLGWADLGCIVTTWPGTQSVGHNQWLQRFKHGSLSPEPPFE